MFGEVDRASLIRMTARLRHRGPDGTGVELDGLGGLGHTRLSLIDFEGGAQPLRSRRTGRLLAYNGELYNYEELRRELAARGASFATRCDTEVVLAAFDEWGEACVERFDGMYAFAVLEPRRLVVARDPFGIKPLFRALRPDGRLVTFASEVSALLASPFVPEGFDRSSLLEASVLGYPLGDKTFWAGIERVAPGTVMEIRHDDGRLRTSLLHRSKPVPQAPVEDPGPIPQGTLERCEEHLSEQVRLQCIADHPVGVLLSGGLDSSIIATLARRHSKQLFTFTLGTVAEDDELAIATDVARALGSEHHTQLVDLDECLRRLPATIATLACPTSFSLVESATARIRSSVKAVLCGDGADELFGGYLAHRTPSAWLGFVQGKLARVAGDEWCDARAELEAVLGALAEEPPQTLRNAVYRFFLDNQLSVSHLERWDHLSMADGLEVRVPYLCAALARLPADLRWPSLLDESGGKRIMKEIARRILPDPVREQVVGRRKRPFWQATAGLYGGLQAFVRSTVPDDLRRTHPLRSIFDGPESQFFFDLFALIFAGHRGVVPDGFTVRDLYRDRWGLRDILLRLRA